MDEHELFNTALETSDLRERAAFLASACGEDAGLRQRIEALLALHDEAGDFLACSPFDQRAWAETGVFDGNLSGTDELSELPLDFLGHSDDPHSLGRIGQYEII